MGNKEKMGATSFESASEIIDNEGQLDLNGEG